MANESLIFDILARDGASPSLKKVGDAALEASGSLKDLSGKLKDINGRTAAARVKLDGDKEAQAELDKLDVKLIRLGKAVANPNVKLDGVARARADISGIDLALDRLNAKSASPDVSGGGGLGGLLGGAGGAGGAASSGGGGLLSSPAGIGAIAGGGLLAAGLVPGAVGLGIGGGVGLGGLGLVSLIATQGAATIKLDQAQVKAAKSAPQLAAANKQLAADMKANSPFIAITADIKGLLAPLQQILTPFAKALDPIIKSFGSGLAKLGPQITAMFQASLPFVQLFANLMLQMGKTLFPVLTQAMNQMVKSGALKEMTQGLVYLIQGLAGFVVALGPGMKASGQIFERICLVIKGAMIGVGIVVSAVANILETNWPAAVRRMRHDVATSFDALRHDVSSIWDKMWSNTLGRLQRGVADDQRLVANFRHNIANTFDGLRHDIASAWDTIWTNTVTRVRNGISAVVGWFRGLPGKAVGALFGLGHSLAAFASAAISQMWTGFKNTFSAVIHWFTGLPKMILHALGIHSPPGWAISAGKFIMQGLHIGLGHGLGQLTSFTTGIGSRVAAGLSGAVGGSGVTRWAPDILRALAMLGQSSANLGAVEHRMAQESGGNPFAINLTDSNAAMGDPSRGLMQTIGTTFAAYRSWSLPDNIYNPMANIFAGLNYALHAYPGRSLSSVMLQPGGYDQGGWLMPGVTLAVNKTGKPERVLAPGQSGGATPVVLQVRTAHGATNLDRALVEIIQKYVTVNGGDVQASLGRT